MKQYTLKLTCGQTLVINSEGTTNPISINNCNGTKPIEIEVTEYETQHSFYFKFMQGNALIQIFGDSYGVKD